MGHISQKTFKFLKDLAANNEREWFKENKGRYEAARAEFTEYVTELISEIAKFDPDIAGLEAKKCIFRIYKDTRFSKDKTPYKLNLGAHLVAKNEKPHDRAGYYIQIQPGNCFLAGGAYMPPGPWIKAIRQEIDYNAADFKKILKSASFKKYFGEMEGEQLKTAPRGYPKDHPEIELLRYKSFLAVHQLTEKQVLADDFVKHSIKVFKALQPFDQFLNDALN